MILHLPLPPSVNEAYGNNSRGKGRGRFKTKVYRQWLKDADAYLLSQKRGLVPVHGPAMVVIKLPMSMRGDVSNRIKISEDFLVSRGLTSDDSKNVFVGAIRSADVERGLCQIVVKPA